MPNISTRPQTLPEELGMYVDKLRKRCPSIDEVWLLGPPAERSDGGRRWQLLAFGDRQALAEIRSTTALRRDDLHLLVVTDGDRFESGWGDPKPGRLTDLDWRLENPQSATYIDAEAPATDDDRAVATRVR